MTSTRMTTTRIDFDKLWVKWMGLGLLEDELGETINDLMGEVLEINGTDWEEFNETEWTSNTENLWKLRGMSPQHYQECQTHLMEEDRQRDEHDYLYH